MAAVNNQLSTRASLLHHSGENAVLGDEFDLAVKVLKYRFWFINCEKTLKTEHAIANVELRHGDELVKLKALVDTGAGRSIISKRLADELNAFIPLREPYELRTADEMGRLRVMGMCRVNVIFQGVEVPGGAVFEAAQNLRRDMELVIGRPEIDAWNIVFTPEGLSRGKYPKEYGVGVTLI